MLVVPLFGIVVSNITIYLKTRSDNALALKRMEEHRKADREDAERQRRWDLEDRAKVAADLKLASASLHSAVQEAGVKADAAYAEANHSNLKIASLQLATAAAIADHDRWERDRAAAIDPVA
jgi:hypothetical protein